MTIAELKKILDGYDDDLEVRINRNVLDDMSEADLEEDDIFEAEDLESGDTIVIINPLELD